MLGLEQTCRFKTEGQKSITTGKSVLLKSRKHPFKHILTTTFKFLLINLERRHPPFVSSIATGKHILLELKDILVNIFQPLHFSFYTAGLEEDAPFRLLAPHRQTLERPTRSRVSLVIDARPSCEGNDRAGELRNMGPNLAVADLLCWKNVRKTST